MVANPKRVYSKLTHFFFSYRPEIQDKRLRTVVSARKKALRKKKQGGQIVSVDDIDWERVGSIMKKDSTECKERYMYLLQFQENRGPVPWTRYEDKLIRGLVIEHGAWAKKISRHFCGNYY